MEITLHLQTSTNGLSLNAAVEISPSVCLNRTAHYYYYDILTKLIFTDISSEVKSSINFSTIFFRSCNAVVSPLFADVI